jgi:hypothetical protein
VRSGKGSEVKYLGERFSAEEELGRVRGMGITESTMSRRDSETRRWREGSGIENNCVGMELKNTGARLVAAGVIAKCAAGRRVIAEWGECRWRNFVWGGNWAWNPRVQILRN